MHFIKSLPGNQILKQGLKKLGPFILRIGSTCLKTSESKRDDSVFLTIKLTETLDTYFTKE